MGVVAQGTQDGTGSRHQAVLASGGRELAEARAEDETALHVTRNETVVLEGNGETMGCRTGQSGSADELREGRGPGL